MYFDGYFFTKINPIVYDIWNGKYEKKKKETDDIICRKE